MIKIEARGDSIRIFGHSGYAEKGKDIVCAAVSALTMGSGKIWEARTGVEFFQNSESDFIFRFSWQESDADLRSQYWFLKEHYKLIASCYPAYVSYSE